MWYIHYFPICYYILFALYLFFLNYKWRNNQKHIHSTILQLYITVFLHCSEFRKHSVSASATATVKIKFLWTTAGSKMFYVLWRMHTSWGRCGKLLMTYIYVWGRSPKLCLVPKRRLYKKTFGIERVKMFGIFKLQNRVTKWSYEKWCHT